MTKKPKPPPYIRDPYKGLVEPIGKLAIHVAVMEKYVRWAIRVLTKLQEVDEAATMLQIRHLDARITLLHTLGKVHIKSKTDLAEFNHIIAELRRIKDERNRILHGSWSGQHRDPMGAELEFFKFDKVIANGKLRHRPHIWSATEIRKLASDALHVAAAYRRL